MSKTTVSVNSISGLQWKSMGISVFSHAVQIAHLVQFTITEMIKLKHSTLWKNRGNTTNNYVLLLGNIQLWTWSKISQWQKCWNKGYPK